MQWFLHTFGIDDTTGQWYAFWSGAGSDLTELALIGVLWHRFNCHVFRCFKIAVHRDPQTGHATCRKHRAASRGD